MCLAGVAYTRKVPLFPCLLCGIIFIPAFSESSTPMEKKKKKTKNKQNNKPLNLPLDSRTLELLGSSYWLKWIKERLPAAGEGNWAGRSEEEQWSTPFSALGLSKPTIQAKGRGTFWRRCQHHGRWLTPKLSVLSCMGPKWWHEPVSLAYLSSNPW